MGKVKQTRKYLYKLEAAMIFGLFGQALNSMKMRNQHLKESSQKAGEMEKVKRKIIQVVTVKLK